MHTSLLCPFCMNPATGEICPHCGRNVNYPGKIGHLPVGFTLQWIDTYILGAAIGQGGFGITYIAVNADTMEKVAIKEYFPTHCCTRTDVTTVYPYSDQEEAFTTGKHRFLEEARMLKSLSDLDSVVNVLDLFEANNSAYLVMEYLEGSSLKDRVEKHGKLPAQAFLNQMKPLMADMEKMHRRGVVHRDIAPDNIIMLPDGRMKLIDFGSARSYVGDKSMTVVVKKGFAPVEQYMRKGSNSSTDVYALAATIYYCITGIVPPDSAERQYGEAELIAPTALGVDLSQTQELALEKALEIQPKERTQTIAGLINALEQISGSGEPKAASSQEQVTLQRTESQKKPKWWIPVAAALVLCIGAGVLFMRKDQPAGPVQTEPVQIATPETTPAAAVNTDEQRYNEAVDLFNNGEYGKAAIAFGKLGDFRDAKTISRQIWDALTPEKTIGTGCFHTVAVKNDGTVLVAGRNQTVKRNISEWNDIVSVTAGDYHTVGLKNDGTVLAIGSNTSGQCDVSDWTDIVDIVAGESYTAGLKSDGTVVLAGSIPNVETIKSWDNIVAIVGERIFLAGLKVDGSALFSERSNLNQKNVIGLAIMANGNSLTIKDDGSVLSHNGKAYKGDFVSVFGGGHVTLAIQRDGTAIIDGTIESDTRILSKDDWEDLNRTDIVAFDASYGLAVILKKDGTVSAYGDNKEGECNVTSWRDIRLPGDRDALLAQIKLQHITSKSTPEPISTGHSSEKDAYNEAVSLFRNGEYGKAAIAFHNLGDFRDAKNISRQIWDALTPERTIGTGRYHTVAVKNDGTILGCGSIHGDAGKKLSTEGQNIKEWRDIVSVTAGDYHTVGLKKDGTVIATGLNSLGQCDVSHWTDIVDIVAGENYTAGLKSDGTVVYTGSIFNAGVIGGWDNIVSIVGEKYTLAGLRADGSALFTDQDDLIKKNITSLAVVGDEKSITIDDSGTLTLRNGVTYQGDFVSVFGGGDITIALRHNGTFITDGALEGNGELFSLEELNDPNGTDIVTVDASYGHAIALRKDGTVVGYGDHRDGRLEVKSWKDIRLPKDRDALLSAIELDYITE